MDFWGDCVVAPMVARIKKTIYALGPPKELWPLDSTQYMNPVIHMHKSTSESTPPNWISLWLLEMETEVDWGKQVFTPIYY